MTREELEIAKSAYCVGAIWGEYEGTEQFDEMVGKRVQYLIGLVRNYLQQEQPAKRGYKDCNGCEYNRLLSDQIGWKFRGCFGGDYNGKPIAEIELCPLKVAVQQIWPEVGLEKLGEIARHLIAVKDHEEDMRLSDDEWSLLERIGYPQKLNAIKEE